MASEARSLNPAQRAARFLSRTIEDMFDLITEPIDDLIEAAGNRFSTQSVVPSQGSGRRAIAVRSLEAPASGRHGNLVPQGLGAAPVQQPQ